MATIAQIVAQIRTAIFGKDVRENIAQGIEKCYEDSTANAQIALIEAKGATERSAIEAKGAETRASIPDDYTELSDNVVNLKSVLSSVNNNEILYFTKNYYVDTNPSSGGITPLSPKTAQSYQYIAIACAEGDTFTVTADTTGSNSHFKAWAFVDSSGTSLKAETTGESIKNKLITAPANTVYLVVNSHMANESFVCKGDAIQNRVSKAENNINRTDESITALIDCVRKNLVPYACNKSGNGASFTVTQNGNLLTVNGTSTATAGQSYTKILITDHIEIWNSASSPESSLVYPIELLAGHIYKISCKVISGTRDDGGGSGYIGVRILPSSGELTASVYVGVGETYKSNNFMSSGEKVRILATVSRLMTVTDLVLQIWLEDVTDAEAISDEVETRLQFEDRIALITGNELIDEWNIGHWYYTGSGTVDIDSPVVRTESACIHMACSKGDRFTITGVGGTSNYALYAFVDDEGNILAKAKSRTTVTNAVVEAPGDSAYLIVNTQDNTRPYSLYKGAFVDVRLSDLENKGNDIPEYYYTNGYLTNKINAVLQRALNVTGDSFVFITDYHAHKNANHSLPIISKIHETTGISKLFCGGDIGTSTGLSSTNTNAAALKAMQSAIPDFYACVGNHEWKVSDSSYSGATYSSVYNYYICQMEAKTSCMSDFGDFWIDSKGAKIRYFFLNQNVSPMLTDISLKWFIQELPKVPAGFGIVVVMHHAYHSKTYNTVGSRKYFGMLNWWDNVVGQRNLTVRRISQILEAVRTGTTVKYALRPYDSTRKKEANITPRDHTTAEKNSCGDYDPILSTFSDGTNTGAWTDIVTFDGSAMNAGVYPIAIFCGHKHEDAAYDPATASSFDDMTDKNTVYLLNGTWYRYDSDPESETYEQRVAMLPASGAPTLSQTETVPPILVVLTTTDCYALNHPDIDPTVREYDTISEQAFDIVQIDTVGRKVYCTRIGAGNDRVFSF